MAEREYEVVLVPELEGGFSVFVPELPSVATQGETVEEALAMARDAIEGYLATMREEGWEVPVAGPRARSGPRLSERLPAVKPKQLIRVLEKKGWEPPSRTIVWRHEGDPRQDARVVSRGERGAARSGWVRARCFPLRRRPGGRGGRPRGARGALRRARLHR